jgi:transposase
MARYKHYDYKQKKMLVVDFDRQILPGSFEHTLSYLIDNELDLSEFDARFNNDDVGRPAYDPAILLKIILAAYARGVTSSRKIEQLCRENIVFIALSADSQPHFTTIADFVSGMHDLIAPLFMQVLLVCDQAGLIGKEMFAIDGCKLPSNASKEWSGTHADLTKKQRKIDRAVRRMLAKHRDEDRSGATDAAVRAKEAQQIEKLRSISKKIKKHLATTTDRIGHRGQPIKSNLTDPDSAKMKTSHGVIQGYAGVAAVDSKHQVIVAAEAFGEGQEQRLFTPMVEAIPAGWRTGARFTADAGYHSAANVQYCEDRGLDAYIADQGFRARDPRFSERDRFKPADRSTKRYFTPDDFSYDSSTATCRCPAGKLMWRRVTARPMGQHRYDIFQGHLEDCRSCPLQSTCMRKPPEVNGRQVAIRVGRNPKPLSSPLTRMREKIDSDAGRARYSERIGTVEPVFGNINTTMGLRRFSLRSKPKVNTQWLLFSLAHNIGKLQRYGALA